MGYHSSQNMKMFLQVLLQSGTNASNDHALEQETSTSLTTKKTIRFCFGWIRGVASGILTQQAREERLFRENQENLRINGRARTQEGVYFPHEAAYTQNYP
eukprot:07843_5